MAPIIASQLYGASGQHAFAVAAGAVMLVLVASIASFVPARRAALVDPLVTLRDP